MDRIPPCVFPTFPHNGEAKPLFHFVNRGAWADLLATAPNGDFQPLSCKMVCRRVGAATSFLDRQHNPVSFIYKVKSPDTHQTLPPLV
ncbi:hypothetical protein CFR80_15150 [Komagataeibacter oboediens]|uniref:Uncharacterized protein n=1 Tax=Komagataeibacter oboediens TaxID=65958 RepID=A0A318QPC2_9PROT|nr:hypothetical protein CFR80_15150 [Komagataeibacter oboediens]